jgi:hypothetical protein
LQLAKDYKYHDLSFDVSGRDDVDDETLQLIGDAGVRWKKIDVGACKNITKKGFVHLVKCQNVEIMNLSASDVDDGALRFIGDAGARWKKLDLFDTKVTSKGILALKRCPHLLVRCVCVALWCAVATPAKMTFCGCLWQKVLRRRWLDVSGRSSWPPSRSGQTLRSAVFRHSRPSLLVTDCDSRPLQWEPVWDFIERAGKTSEYPRGSLPKLTVLDLSNCNLSGPLFFCFLKWLDPMTKHLSDFCPSFHEGAIPKGLENLGNLTKLLLNNNKLSGQCFFFPSGWSVPTDQPIFRPILRREHP